MTTEASLVALNEALPSPVGMDRFRPNIVIGGTEPFAEVCISIYKVKSLSRKVWSWLAMVNFTLWFASLYIGLFHSRDGLSVRDGLFVGWFVPDRQYDLIWKWNGLNFWLTICLILSICWSVNFHGFWRWIIRLRQIICLSCENCHDNREENLGFYRVSQFSGVFNSRNTSFFLLPCFWLCDSTDTKKFYGKWSYSCFLGIERTVI